MTNLTNELPDSEKLARLRLMRTDGIGPVTFRQLLSRFGSAERAIPGMNDLARKGGRHKDIKPADQGACERELAALAAFGGTALFWGTSLYPPLLAEIEDAPPVLFVAGDPARLFHTSVGIVGARNASATGLKLTRTIAAGLSAKGVTIVSGLARGVDTAAHMASLAGGTVACVAGGLDIIYPPENRALHAAICEGGAIVSEMAMGAEPQARHFPRRNRLISGLSKGVLVVEAARRSGSLITARFAADQGRDVYAVPGSPLDPRAEGTNQLIKDGATLVRDAADILAELDSLPLMHTPVIRASRHTDLPPARPVPDGPRAGEALLSMLTQSPIHMDEIVRLSGLPADTVSALFLEYELAGKIARHSGGRVSRLL
ncbi:MAG: DNA-protecting protein DprA [Alphaproteobacteria bacterium]|nr:MAG: DNA-protecting protein DprA [Alphaproteobacteria bacterium]